MVESKQGLDPAKQYQKAKQKLALLRLVLDPALLALFFLTPLSASLKHAAVSVTQNEFGLIAVYVVCFSAILAALEFPLSWYSGFRLEHKFDLSNQDFKGWLSFWAKKWALSLTLSLALMEGLYWLIRTFPETWWIYAWAGFACISYLLGKILPVFIVPIFYKYGGVEDEGLKQRIYALAKRYALPVENIYSLNLSKTTKKANAAFMGMGKTKRVVLSDTLLENFTPDEIETVVAHELGHFKHKDIWKNLGFGITVSFVGFWLVFQILGPALSALGFEGAADIGGLPVLLFVFHVFQMLVTPLQSGFSRTMERAADAFALEAYPRKDVFISCMRKLGKVNLADPDPHPLYEWYFYDHPSIGKRIRMGEEWKG